MYLPTHVLLLKEPLQHECTNLCPGLRQMRTKVLILRICALHVANWSAKFEIDLSATL